MQQHAAAQEIFPRDCTCLIICPAPPPDMTCAREPDQRKGECWAEHSRGDGASCCLVLGASKAKDGRGQSRLYGREQRAPQGSRGRLMRDAQDSMREAPQISDKRWGYATPTFTRFFPSAVESPSSSAHCLVATKSPSPPPWGGGESPTTKLVYFQSASISSPLNKFLFFFLTNFFLM